MTRLSSLGVAAQAYKAMRTFEDYTKSAGLEPQLMELVKLRASYINGCAYCVDMHTKDARAAGETEQRLYAVPVWRETPFFTPRERAALAWTEAVTEIGRNGVSDELYRETLEEFTEKELIDLTMAVIAINGWNRLAIPFQSDVGSYQVGQRPAALVSKAS
jgi:AhpD family alkylhydroperoxidase